MKIRGVIQVLEHSELSLQDAKKGDFHFCS